jgi:diguanylate cyclase (GGDEF)-like protein/PAS domain S-box-containing protein
MRSKFMENSGQSSTSDLSQTWQERTAEGHQHESGRSRGTNPVHILHLEDSQEDRGLIEFMLKDAGIDCEISAVETRSEYIQNLVHKDWDLILCDFSVPSLDGLEALEIAFRTCPSTPFIFVTGTTGEDVVVESLRSGATDYVLKQKIARLVPSVRRALNERGERLQRQRAEAELDKSEKRVRFLAFHDPLTDLPNRAFFQERLPEILADAARRGERVALLNIDLDNFKNINDSLGHPAGDLILQQVAVRLKRHTREGDLVARLGGDEFVIVVGAESDCTDAGIAAERIKNGLAAEFKVHDKIISISCSIGISVFPEDGRDLEALFKNADAALFSAKEEGRNRWQFFVPEMNRRAIERLSIESALRSGLKNGQFFLEYQPQIELSTGRIIGAEALLRWQHPEDGLIPPSQFISVAETTGEIIPIGAWVLKTACTQAKQWQDEGIPPITMAVNISAVQVRQGSLLATVKEILDETGLAPEFLELETTESLLLAHDEKVATQMRGLRNLGLRMAIDDFGTGYSSFGYVRRFRFDRLKIDGSFVQNLTMDPEDTEIVSGIISFGATLKMEVIAECVETSEQVEILRSLGCGQIQGHYFSQPLGAAAFAEMLRSQSVPMPALPRPVPNALQLSRKRLEMAISLSEALMESLPAAVCIINASGKVRRWNKNFLGYSADEMQQAGIMRAVAPENIELLQRVMIEAFEHGKTEGEGWLLAKNDTKIPCYLKGVRIEFENEPCMLGVAIDLSKLKQAEEELGKSREEYEVLFESIGDAVFVSEVEENFTPGKFTRVNKAASEYLGYTREELYEMSPRDINDPATVQNDLEQPAVLGLGKRVLIETNHIAKNGRKIPVEINASTVQLKSGPVGLAIVRDITERKRAEELLQNSESKYRALFESAADAYLLMGEKGFLDCNSAALQMFGYSTKAEFLALHPAEYSPPTQPDGTDSRVGSEQRMAAAFRNGSTRFDWVHKRKNGELFPAEVCMSAIKLNSGPALLGTIRDLTDHKQAEEALRKSEEQYRLLFESNPIPMWIFDRSTLRFLSVNQAAILKYGYSELEFLAMTIADIRPEEDIPDLRSHVANRESGLQSPEVWRHRKKDGTIIDVEIVGHDLNFRGCDGMLVAAHDITDEKRSKEMLKESENKYRVLFEDSAEAYWLMDETGFLDCNAAGLKIFGFSDKAEFRDPANISPPTQADGTPSGPAAEQRIAAAIKNGKETFEWLHKRKNGDVFPAEICLAALRLGDRPLLLATCRDITERKQAEEALLFKTALLEAQSETAIDGILVVDESDRIVLANRQFGRQFGIPDNLLNSRDDLMVRKYVMDRVEDPIAFIEGVIQLNANHDEKIRDELRFKNGKIFDRYSAPLFDSNARYWGRIWYFRDITERKEAEASLKLFRTLIDQASDAIEVVDPETLRYLDVNETACLSLGYTRDEMLSMRVPDVNLHAEDMRDRVIQALREKGSAQFEAEHRRRDGSIFPVEVKLQMVQSDRAYVVSTARDITERKRAEEAIESLARTDALTGLANRRVLEETLPRETARAKRLKESLSVIFADLDQFKSINDRFGHRAGDQVLARVGMIIKSQLRSYALASRFGGDEFVLLLPGTTKDDAVTVAERIREQVAASAVPECPRPITLSLGVATFEAGESGEELLARADGGLYHAKEKGGNRVERA